MVADEQTGPPEDPAVGRLDPSLADKYRHLTNCSFKQEFLANLLGNQDRDWDNLSYDPERDGLRRVPEIDRELLEQSGRAGPLDAFRRALPAFQQREHILQLVAENQVVVISGETGCGKTTQVVQYLLEEAAAAGRGSLCHVVCTQPRRISAVTVAERVARERGTSASASGGGQVGYAIRLDHRHPRPHGSVLFCTTGVLLQRLQTDPVLARVSHLVVDEVHERDSLADFLVTIVKGLLPVRPDLKVILMSATINSAEFSAYFADCPTAHIPGRAFPVHALYLEDVLQLTGFQFPPRDGAQGGRRPWRRRFPDQAEREMEFRQIIDPYTRQLAAEGRYSPAALSALAHPDSEQFEPELYVALLRHICRHEPEQGAVLVFLSGWDEIGKVHKALSGDPVLGDGESERFLILPLHSMMPTIEQREVFERPPPGRRKIIIATNIAETSITIDDVVFVIDGGKVKMKNVDKNTGCMTLMPEWVSKANSRQRRGRAGRVQPGKCYHLYSRAREATLPDYPVPEILRTRLEELCLQIKILRLGAVAPFLERAMDKPSATAVDLSLQMLRRLRALDEREHLTPLGFHLAKLPLDPQTGKMLIMAAMFSCLDPILTVAACLSFKEPFVVPLGSEQQADLARHRLSEGLLSDHMTMVNAFNLWTAARDRPTFARRNFLSGSTLEMIRATRQQFLEHLHKLRFVSNTQAREPALNENSYNLGVIRAVISAGLYPNVLYARKTRSRVLCSSPEGRVSLHPKCVISRAPSLPGHWLVYKLKIKSASVTVHDCSLVSPYQLLLFGERLDLLEPETTDELPLIAADAFVRFRCPRQTARLIQGLRSELDTIIGLRLSDPKQTDWAKPSHETDVLRLIVELVTSDDIAPAWGGADRPMPTWEDGGQLDGGAGSSWRTGGRSEGGAGAGSSWRTTGRSDGDTGSSWRSGGRPDSDTGSSWRDGRATKHRRPAGAHDAQPWGRGGH
ncbi:LOW QUALITY PROTEIN: ATP-dependent DNA/RNA helicase DHX36-like, partial [Pollicipes pollicipes]|uniref:LOW QUALITY PROTEIN: ATP-dependent DNA/RNA helicase DHX36-like n=1 Tax=Pollicipes pollicipes TaxID=41117 RepID=UPI001884C9AB